MNDQIAIVVQQYHMMVNYSSQFKAHPFCNTTGICFADKYVIQFDQIAQGWDDYKNAHIVGYRGGYYGCLQDLFCELMEQHGWNIDFRGDIPVSLLEAV
jgi:hypothetical protein